MHRCITTRVMMGCRLRRSLIGVNRPRRRSRRRLASAVASLLVLLLVACGEVARPGAPPPQPSPPIVVNAADAPGAAGFPIGQHTPRSDVSFEVRANAATAQLLGILADPTVLDWDLVREGFEAAPAPIGGAPPPSLSTVSASVATGPLGAAYIEYFGSADWLQRRALDAIVGGGAFAASSDATRASALSELLSIELPLIRALVAVEAGERLTASGDLDPRFGAPHAWDRLWVILEGAPRLASALTDQTLAAIQSGAAAAEAGDVAAARGAHDIVRTALLRTALEEIGRANRAHAAAFLRAVEPVLARIDAPTTSELAALFEGDTAPDQDELRKLVAQLADRGGIDASFVSAES